MGPDCGDSVVFRVRSASRGLGLTCERSIVERFRDLSFEPRALRDAREVLSIEQGNLVASERASRRRSLTRCTPPFLLSRSLAARAHAREPLELDFFAYLGQPLSFRFERAWRTHVRVDGTRRAVEALRYLAYDDRGADESLGFFDLDAASPILLRLSRDDDTFGVRLRSILSAS